MEDKQIVALLQQRSEDALHALAEKFGQRLTSLARNILDDEEDARECVNDTYLALWNAIPPEEPDPLSAYAFRVCKNTAISQLRRKNAAKRSEYTLSLDELAECIGEDTLESLVDSRALGQTIDRFLDTLPRQSRVLFLRRYWFGDGVTQLANALGMSQNAVSVRLNRIKGKLRSYLIKEGFYEPR